MSVIFLKSCGRSFKILDIYACKHMYVNIDVCVMHNMIAYYVTQVVMKYFFYFILLKSALLFLFWYYFKIMLFLGNHCPLQGRKHCFSHKFIVQTFTCVSLIHLCIYFPYLNEILLSSITSFLASLLEINWLLLLRNFLGYFIDLSWFQVGYS